MIAPVRPRSVSGDDASIGESPAPIGLELRIETPENVVLTYQTAGPAIRCAAWLIDSAVRGFLMFVLAIVFMCAGIALPGTMFGLLSLVVFFNTWFYFVLFEMIWAGRSPGKRMLGLRVIGVRGHPITFWPSVLRNLLRAVDWFWLFGAAFISMVLTRRFQRLGDLFAGTVVIAERRVVLPREPVILERIDSLPREELGSWTPTNHTLARIDEFLGRRHVLSHERGHELSAPLARSLAKKLNYSGDPALVKRYPMAFLARVYVTYIRREEAEEPPVEVRRRVAKRKRQVAREQAW